MNNPKVPLSYVSQHGELLYSSVGEISKMRRLRSRFLKAEPHQITPFLRPRGYDSYSHERGF